MKSTIWIHKDNEKEWAKLGKGPWVNEMIYLIKRNKTTTRPFKAADRYALDHSILNSPQAKKLIERSKHEN